eukprot:Trichotokara_eunicae@DN427_c0_g1_i1.p1
MLGRRVQPHESQHELSVGGGKVLCQAALNSSIFLGGRDGRCHHHDICGFEKIGDIKIHDGGVLSIVVKQNTEKENSYRVLTGSSDTRIAISEFTLQERAVLLYLQFEPILGDVLSLCFLGDDFYGGFQSCRLVGFNLENLLKCSAEDETEMERNENKIE